jgi:hypothetical protein
MHFQLIYVSIFLSFDEIDFKIILHVKLIDIFLALQMKILEIHFKCKNLKVLRARKVLLRIIL